MTFIEKAISVVMFVTFSTACIILITVCKVELIDDVDTNVDYVRVGKMEAEYIDKVCSGEIPDFENLQPDCGDDK